MLLEGELEASTRLLPQALHGGAGSLHQGRDGLHVPLGGLEEVGDADNELGVPDDLERLQLRRHRDVALAVQRVLLHLEVEECLVVGGGELVE